MFLEKKKKITLQPHGGQFGGLQVHGNDEPLHSQASPPKDGKLMQIHVRSCSGSTICQSHKEETAQRSINRWMGESKMWSFCTAGSSQSKDQVLVPAGTWMNLKNVMLSARSQTQKSHLIRFRLHEIPGISKSTETKRKTDGCQGLAEGKRGATAWQVRLKVPAGRTLRFPTVW